MGTAETVTIGSEKRKLVVKDQYRYGRERRGFVEYKGKRMEVRWTSIGWKVVLRVGDLELE